MKQIEEDVRRHVGTFLCEEIHKERNTKTVEFRHVVTESTGIEGVPDVGDLRDFYSTFGSILFYQDPKSRDAGKYLAPVSTWPELHEYFSGWLENLDEDERSEMVPEWVDTALVIGETPSSGNYILIPTEGAEAGWVFEFEHDGFEFIEEARSIAQYVERLLKPSASTLTEIASHMRFIDGDPMVQWWIRELRDNNGHVVRTNA